MAAASPTLLICAVSAGWLAGISRRQSTPRNVICSFRRLDAGEALGARAIGPGYGAPGAHQVRGILPSLRAAAYGVYVSHGEGQPFANVATVHDTVADLVLTPGANVRIRVKASNAAGQSAPSPIAEITVPVALAEAAYRLASTTTANQWGLRERPC